MVNVHHVASGQDICSETTVTGYGTFTCMTIAAEIAPSDELKLVVDSMQAACLNTASPSDCGLTQALASSPSLSSVALSGDSQIDFTGTNFPTTN